MKKTLIFASALVAIVIIVIAVIAVVSKPTPIPSMNVSYVVDKSISDISAKRYMLLGDIAVKVAMMNTLDVTLDGKTYHCDFKVPGEAGAKSQVIYLVPKEADIAGKYKELSLGDIGPDNAITVCKTSVMSDGTFTHTGKSVSIVSVDRLDALGTERLQAMDVNVLNGWPKDYGAYSAMMEGLCNGVATAELLAFSGINYTDYVNEISQHYVDVGYLAYGHTIKYSIVTKKQYSELVRECQKLKKSGS